MHALFIQLSGLIGLLVFLNNLWNHAPLDRTIFVGGVAGLVVYLAFLVGEVVIRRILEHEPPPLAEEAAAAAPEAISPGASTEAAAAEAAPSPEVRAAPEPTPVPA